MVTVEVNTVAATERREYPDATSYDVLEDGALIIYADDKPYAVYNSRHWVVASMRPEDV